MDEKNSPLGLTERDRAAVSVGGKISTGENGAFEKSAVQEVRLYGSYFRAGRKDGEKYR
jgi:hypothetical protein